MSPANNSATTKSNNTPLEFFHNGFSGQIGVSQQDITPPIGIYARNWGAATHDVADSIHHKLVLNALVFRSGADGLPLVLVEGDLGWWHTESAFESIQSRLLKHFSLEPHQLIFSTCHTHASAKLSDAESDEPGSEMLSDYLELVYQATQRAIEDALKNSQPATIDWHTGRCQLAKVRDLKDPDPNSDRIICGFDPSQQADDTLVVGRVTNQAGEPIATIANYACHPTTLAWENSALSPDFVGAMRDIIGSHTNGAPALFLQGASGELAPRYQYVGDTAVADQHGRQLGFAVLATLEDMQHPNTKLIFDRVVDSGAPLAAWKNQSHTFGSTLKSLKATAALPIKNWPTANELEQARAASTDRAEQERLKRKKDIRLRIGEGTHFPLPIWGWRIGDVVFIGTMAEAYSQLQTELRERFPDITVVCMNLVNGAIGYLPPADQYDNDIYQVNQTPFDRSSLEIVIKVSVDLIQRLVNA